VGLVPFTDRRRFDLFGMTPSCEIANVHRMTNLPDDPDFAIAAGRRLCEDLLEPLQATFGRIAIRSAYRSPAVNAYGNVHDHN
jgi:hypothetical protein